MKELQSPTPQQPLNCDRDAARWAREFNEVLLKNHGTTLDEGWLISWFANAMMCGEDTYRWRQEAQQEQCTYCHQFYPKPVSYHHTTEECRKNEAHLSEMGLKPAEGHCLLQVPQQTSTSPSPCAMAGYCISAGQAAPSAIGAPDPFTLELCEELFGCFIGGTAWNAYCSICEHEIDTAHWVNATHNAGCLVLRAKAYLAKHKPECVTVVAVSDGGGASG